MTSYGSVANPVVLDPFRHIVEVGWNGVTHIIARASYEYFVHNVDGGPCAPPVAGPSASVFHNPQLEFRSFVVTISNVLESGGWVSSKPGMEIVAPPTGPSAPIDFAAWAMVYFGTTGPSETVPPPWQPDDSAVYPIDPAPPISLQIPFQSKNSVSFEHLGELTDPGSVYCTTFGSGTEGVEITPLFREAVHTVALDFSGTTVTYKGRTFNPVAIGTSEPEAFAYEAWRGSGSVYVLFERAAS